MNKSEQHKKALISALTATLGVVTTACKNADVGRTTFYKWYKEDKEFAKEVDDISNITLDFAESKLHQLIDEGNISAVIFYLKTKGKKRGYIEKTELALEGNVQSTLIEWEPSTKEE